MLIGGIALGLVLGFVAGGQLNNLLSIRLRLVQLTFFGLFLRVATQVAIDQQNAPIEALRGPLFLIAFIAILAGLWANREHPGLSLAFVGVLLNTIAVAVNGGHMPVWIPAFEAAGFDPSTTIGTFHVALSGTDSAEFLLKAGPLGDILPIPLPIVRNVASIGDAFLALGLAFFLFSSTVRSPVEVDEATRAAVRRRLTSITPWRVGTFPGTSVVATGRGMGGTAILGGPPSAVPISGFPPILERVRRHPYVRLALDQSFAALWTGQLISLVGDRIHQVAHRLRRLLCDGFADCVGHHVLRRDRPEPPVRRDCRHARGPLGSPRGHDRVRPPAGLARAAPPDRRVREPAPDLPDRLPDHHDLGLLPAGQGRDPAADRGSAGPEHGELRHLDGRMPSPTSAGTRSPACSWHSSDRSCRSRSGQTP